MQVIRESWEDDAGSHELIDKLIGMESQELSAAFQSRLDAARHYADELGRKLEVREARRIGRNDPCPCGSGVKFKKCCGKRLAKDDGRVKD